MAYSPWRYSGDFSSIQKLAGTLKSQAENTDNQIDKAYLMGGANALYMLAPMIVEPTPENITVMMYEKAQKEGIA
jgi:hypothetical protein